MTELITQAEFARRIDVSRAYVSKMVKKGVIKLVDGKIDEATAKAALRSVREPARQSKAVLAPKKPLEEMTIQELRALRDRLAGVEDEEEGVSSGEDLTSYRTKLEKERARLRELERKQKEGSLVSAEEVRQDALDAAEKLKAKLLALPDHLSPRLASLTDIRQIHKEITASITKALTELSTEFLDQ
jgi:phage terminase Nu1 subunit (DNA packaging protein)